MISVHCFQDTNIMYIKCDLGHNYAHQVGGFSSKDLAKPCPICTQLTAARAEVNAFREALFILDEPDIKAVEKIVTERLAAQEENSY